MSGIIMSRAAASSVPLRVVTRDRLVIAVVLLLAAAFLFVDRTTMPIVLWDESRNVVNALEMHRHGLSVVTTYDGRPDLWNTKPPLLIWLMSLSVSLLGASEWALRLPSMVATIGTVLVVLLFARRVTGSLGTAVTAAALLVLSPALFGEHSGRTADYDALLLFCTTAYLCLLFLVLQRSRPEGAMVALAGAAIVGAVLTKGVAGLMPGAGVCIYLLATARVSRLWRTPAYGWAAAGVAAAILSFLGVREVAGPGYWAAMWSNDAGGRFGTLRTEVAHGSDFYLVQLWAGYFAATPLLLAAPPVLMRLRGRSRFVLLYSLAVSVTLLVVVSAAATRLNHYIMPALPFMAIAAAIVLREIVARWRSGVDRAVTAALAAVAVFALFSAVQGAVARRYLAVATSEGARSGSYGTLFARLAGAGAITVVDRGFVNDGVPHYAPVLRAYRLIWAERGMVIKHETDVAAIDRVRGVIASCDGALVPFLLGRRAEFGGVAGCAAIRR